MEKEITKFDDWPLELGLHLTSVEAQRVQAIICSYHRCFVFNLQDFEGYNEKPIHIELEDKHHILRRPYRILFSRKIGV